MNDKEKLKILAEAVINTYIDENCCGNCKQSCKHCDSEETVVKDKKGKIKETLPIEHKPDCPVLLAEEVLKDPSCNICGGLGTIIKNDGHGGTQVCPHCKEGSIEPVKGTEPYSEDYLMCNKCDSTFNKEDKKPMKLYELQHYVDKLIAQGYSDVPVYFDTEAKSYDCHIVPIGSINIVPEEAVGEDHIVLSEYIEKPEDPLIVHNVMTYRGKNYLKQRYEQNHDCDICGLSHTNIDDCREKTQCNRENDFYWKSFDDIQITDELACMRKDIGDIYVFNIQEDQIDKLVYVENDSDMYVHTLGWRSTNDNMRLATAEEIQKYLEDKK